MKHPLSPLGLALCVPACCLASGVFASESAALTAPAFLSLNDAAPQTVRWQAVGDDVLAQQTGKHAGDSMISGFVLNLLSQWQLPNGASASAHGSPMVSENAANHLTAQIGTSARVHDD